MTHEIAHRCRYGNAGLAQWEGFLNTEALIQSISKFTRIEAVKIVVEPELLRHAAGTP